VLLLDEPTTGVDIGQRDIMRSLIAAQSAGRVTVISSHIVEDLEELCDRVLVLRRGKVRFLGTIDDAQDETGAATFADALLTLSGSAP
jgi:ABC-2 type transport system ATP-binding protein